MKIAEADLRTIDWAKVDKRRREEGLTQVELSEMIGKSQNYISNASKKNRKVHKDTAQALIEVLDLDAPAEEKPADGGAVLDYLIAEIGALKGEIEAMRKKLETPRIVSIPMHPKEMAVRVLENLLEGGWCTKDEVLIAFNEKHIPLDYLHDAIKANGAVSATSGVADKARTFYIKEG